MSVHVIMPFRSGDEWRDPSAAVVTRWWKDELGLDVTRCDDPNPCGFNRGRAINRAVDGGLGGIMRWSPHDVLVFTDADVIPARINVERAIGQVVAGRPAYAVPFTEVRYLTPDATRAVQAGHPLEDRHELYEGVWERLSTGGLNVLTVQTWCRAGGFDPRFTGWGFEDAAFDIAARTLTGRPPAWVDGPLTHLWHPPARDPESEAYQHGLALCRRYEAADGDHVAVAGLVSERRKEG